MRRRPVVGVATLRQVELGAVGAQYHSVGRMVLLRARQAADQVDLGPAAAVPRQLRKDAGIGVEVEIGEVADARIARGDVDHRIGGSARDQDAGDLPLGDRGVQRAVVIVIGYVLDEAQRLRLDRRPLARRRLRDVVDLDDAVLLGDVEPAVRTELQRRGVRKSAHHGLGSERDCHCPPRYKTNAGRTERHDAGEEPASPESAAAKPPIRAQVTDRRYAPSVARGGNPCRAEGSPHVPSVE